ncbi:MAG: hypothetical protein WBO36_06060, partial [Saprospiraceae bacterium]
MAKHIFVLTILSTFLVLTESWSQTVPKKIVVEHFTNTRCSVCAFRNPGFYAALPKSDNILHISYHPSSPYSTCLFNTQNRAENDARAYHYDVFGGTPVFVINGEPRTGSDVQNVSVYNPFFGSMSPFKVETSLESHHPDSITIISRIEAVETHTFTDISIYLPLAEDTVFYNAPNGENIHRDVFRQSFTGTEPLVIKAPIKSADPTSIKRTLQVRSIWDTSRLYAMSIVQSVSGDKPVLQSSKSPLLSKGSISSSDDESVKT